MILGVVITDFVIVQRLSECSWVGLDSILSESHITHVAGVLWALKTSLGILHSYYENLHPTSNSLANSRYFPSITTYPDGNRVVVEFEYVGFLENTPDCATLRARTKAGRTIVVKFVERYGERAHRVLAAEGLAPALLYCGSPCFDQKEPSYQSISMVVMEYIDGDTLAVERGSGMDEATMETMRSEVQRALKLLHDQGLVFGDLRRPNIMITKDGKVKLIDFNWAGEDGQAKYPSLISQELRWPDGVKAMAVIRKEHDLAMLRSLF